MSIITLRPPAQGVWQRVRELVARPWGRITEAVATTQAIVVRRIQITTRRWTSSYAAPTNDLTRPDYSFWRRLYFGQAVGLELAGMLVKPLVSKVAAWSMGQTPLWKCENQSSQKALTDWWTEHHPQILQSYRSSLKQGDSFLVINSDLSVTVVDPRNVDPIVDLYDYAVIVGWRITQVLSHPDTMARQVVIDEYYVDRRVHIVRSDGEADRTTIFPNLIDRVPVVHVGNQVGEGEIFGHPEAEGTIRLLQRYGEVFDAAVEGNILQGRPTPVINFESATDLNKFWEVYGSVETRTLPNGTKETVPTLDVDLSQLLTMTKGQFDYKTPGNFTEDVATLLELMFYLFLEHSEIPEFVMGNAIASSKASTEQQMPIFEAFIQGKQAETRTWLVETASIVLAYLSLLEPGVVAEEPSVSFRKISSDGRLTLATVEWAYSVGLIDDLTALRLAPAEVPDMEEVLQRAKQQFEERQQKEAATEVMTFAGRQNASAKSKVNPISDDAEVKDNEDRVQSRVKN